VSEKILFFFVQRCYNFFDGGGLQKTSEAIICILYVCRLFNNIEFRANPPSYTIAQDIKLILQLILQ
jgi:hypothetical protein